MERTYSYNGIVKNQTPSTAGFLDDELRKLHRHAQQFNAGFRVKDPSELRNYSDINMDKEVVHTSSLGSLIIEEHENSYFCKYSVDAARLTHKGTWLNIDGFYITDSTYEDGKDYCIRSYEKEKEE